MLISHENTSSSSPGIRSSEVSILLLCILSRDRHYIIRSMCLVSTFLPWVVDFFNSLGYTITIQTPQDESRTSARTVSSTPTAPYSSYSSHSSSSAFPPFISGTVALLEGGGREISMPATLQVSKCYFILHNLYYNHMGFIESVKTVSL